MMQLRRAMIFVKNLAAMTAFYRDGLGLAVVSEPAGTWVELGAGASGIALHAIPAAIADGIAITSPPQPRETTPIKLVFATDDLDAARAHLIAQGAVMYDPQSWGACDGVDPEGNVFQIVAR